MNLLIGQGRRITIPKDLLEQCNLKEGDTIQVNVKDNCIVLTKSTTTTNIKVEQKTVKTQPGNNESTKNSVKHTPPPRQIIIKSNIEDKDKYTKPLLSECGLVVRSKRRYIKDFCELCRGQLIHNDSNHKCIYNKTTLDSQIVKSTNSSNKDVINNIKQNTQVLQNKLTTIITKTKKEDIKGKTIITPVKLSKGLKCCVNCGEYFNKGFLLNDDFYCRECTMEDFLKYRNEKIKGGN